MEFDPTHPERAPRIRRLENAVIDAGSSRDLVQLEAGADSLSLPELLRLVDAGAGRGPAAQPYRVRLHERLAEPVKLFVFALLAIPLGFSVERSRSLVAAAARGIAALALFTLAWRAGVLFALNGFASATFAPWLVLAACAALSGWRLLRPAR
jgi:lipopolysaccharide export LptBFGC system permease protein LptF